LVETSTPHSQFLQVTFRLPVFLSTVRRPQALSEMLALPTYAQADEELRTSITLLCIRSPDRTLLHSRIMSRGKVVASHHSRCKHIVPPDCVPPRLCATASWEGKYIRNMLFIPSRTVARVNFLAEIADLCSRLREPSSPVVYHMSASGS